VVWRLPVLIRDTMRQKADSVRANPERDTHFQSLALSVLGGAHASSGPSIGERIVENACPIGVGCAVFGRLNGTNPQDELL